MVMADGKRQRPRIGGVGQQREQYGVLGGKRQDGDASIKDAEKASDSLDVETPERSNVEVLKRSNVQASDKPKRVRQTVYIEPEHDKWIRHRIADTREDISDVINLAIAYYREFGM
jgi:hypothetical protein